MGRRAITNLVLLALVVALAMTAWLLPDSGDADSYPVTTLARDDVNRIRVSQVAGPDIVLERQDRNWRLTGPFAARANGFRIDSLLSITTATSDVRLAATDLARYGLEKPSATLQLNDVELNFGDSHPINYRRYLQSDGQIYLVADSVFRHLLGVATDFVDPALLGELEPTGLELPDLRLTLGETGWVAEPPRPDLSADRITALVDEWRYARALDVRRLGEAPDGELLRVRYNTGGTAQWLDLRVLERTPDLVLYRPDEGLAYRFPADVAARLLALPPQADAGTPGG